MTEQTGSVLAGNPTETAGATGETVSWTASITDPAVKTWVETKGFKDPGAAAQSAWHLEKLLGADKAGRAIIPPKDDAAPEEWGAFYGKLGRPETPDGYKLPVPEGDAGEFAKVAATWFHEAGVPAKSAELLAGKWNEFSASTKAAADEEYDLQSAVDVQGLQKEWRGDFDQNQELARRAVRESGLTAEEAQSIERAIGMGKASRVFAALGRSLGEAPMKGGVNDGATPSLSTKAGAQAKLDMLKSDSAFTAKYLAGDKQAVKTMTDLIAIAGG